MKCNGTRKTLKQQIIPVQFKHTAHFPMSETQFPMHSKRLSMSRLMAVIVNKQKRTVQYSMFRMRLYTVQLQLTTNAECNRSHPNSSKSLANHTYICDAKFCLLLGLFCLIFCYFDSGFSFSIGACTVFCLCVLVASLRSFR